MMPQQQEDLARKRFTALTLLRASGVALMLLGMGIFASKAIQPSELIGGALFAVGLMDSLVLPRILTRKWRTPPAA
jgi:hypothetical protein